MKSENYKALLLADRENPEMTSEEFKNTLEHFAELSHKERSINDRIPDSDLIRMQAREMDEKDFDQWWWEIIYKNR
tara:strand:+ start:105 stop:332 length:228 start_codon:yes stop_codon:yes gene_type:complete